MERNILVQHVYYLINELLPEDGGKIGRKTLCFKNRKICNVKKLNNYTIATSFRTYNLVSKISSLNNKYYLQMCPQSLYQISEIIVNINFVAVQHLQQAHTNVRR